MGSGGQNDALIGESREVLILNTPILILQKTALRTFRKSSRPLRLSLRQAQAPTRRGLGWAKRYVKW